MRGLHIIETRRARVLRRNATSAERILWKRLQNRGLAGFRFVRQEPIGPYFADFLCRDRKLIVEIDGESHSSDEELARDNFRNAYLEEQGYRVIRFANAQVFENVDAVTLPSPACGRRWPSRQRGPDEGDAATRLAYISTPEDTPTMRDDTPRERFRQARSLRRDMTNAEAMLWRNLRGRGLDGAKFRRQVPIGPFIADFACMDRRLIVELDGRPHEEPDQQARDRRRDAWFAENGWRVLRLSNDRVGGGAALDDISRALRRRPSPDPASPGHPLPRAGEGLRPYRKDVCIR